MAVAPIKKSARGMHGHEVLMGEECDADDNY